MAELVLQVAASADDARETQSGTGLQTTNSELTMNSNSNPASAFISGVRFTGDFPASGTQLDSAVLELFFHDLNADDANFTIYAEDADAAVDFSTTASITTRPKTTASVDWVEDAVRAAGAAFFSKDITAPVQEVIDRAGFTGAALMILLEGKADVTKTCNARSFDSGDGSQAAKLTLTYTEAAVSSGGHKRRMLLGIG